MTMPHGPKWPRERFIDKSGFICLDYAHVPLRQREAQHRRFNTEFRSRLDLQFAL